MPNVQCLSCGDGIWLDDTTYANYQGRVVCPSCRNYQDVVIQKKQLISANVISDIYGPVRDILAWDFPADILADLGEASVCLGVNALKSCVVMCRRCVQAILLDKDVADNPDMHKMIDDAKAAHKLTDELAYTAHAVRFFAVTGAHVKDPLLRNVSKVQALLAIESTKEIIKGVYPLRQPEPE